MLLGNNTVEKRWMMQCSYIPTPPPPIHLENACPRLKGHHRGEKGFKSTCLLCIYVQKYCTCVKKRPYYVMGGGGVAINAS
jgi:hypothetical protein